jgi:hypothetical protein
VYTVYSSEACLVSKHNHHIVNCLVEFGKMCIYYVFEVFLNPSCFSGSPFL